MGQKLEMSVTVPLGEVYSCMHFYNVTFHAYSMPCIDEFLDGLGTACYSLNLQLTNLFYSQSLKLLQSNWFTPNFHSSVQTSWSGAYVSAIHALGLRCTHTPAYLDDIIPILFVIHIRTSGWKILYGDRHRWS